MPPDQARYDLEIFQAQYAQLSIALEESLASTSFHSHGPSPLPHMESPLLMSNPLVLIQLRCVDLPVQTGLDPPRMTARVQETLIAVTIASVAVHTNATISESLIATPLHTEGDPVLGSRLLPDIWTSPASPLRLTIRHRENVSHLMCHSRDDPPPGGHRRLHRSASPHGGPRRIPSGPRRLLRGASPHGSPRRLPRSASPTQRRVASRRTQSPTQRRVTSRRTPSPCSETRRLTADPVACSETCCLTADPVAYSEARRLTADPVAYSEARRLQGVTPS